MRIVIINQFNSDNIGDNLIGESMQRAFSGMGVDAELAGYAQMTFQQVRRSDPSLKTGIIGKIKSRCPEWVKFLLLYRKRIDREIERIGAEKTDAVIIGGGQLIKHSSVFSFCFNKWVRYAMKNGIPFCIYGVGADDDLNAFEKRLYSKGIKHAVKVVCRNSASAEYLESIYKRQVHVSPDAVFSMEPPECSADGRDLVVMPYTFDTAKRHFKSLSSRELYYEDMVSLIEREKYDDLILTATTSKDLDECYSFGEYLNEKGISYRVAEAANPVELTDIFGRAKKIITGRMHAMIVGMICRKEIIPLEISPKIAEFNNEFLHGDKGIERIREESVNGMLALLEDIVKHINSTEKIEGNGKGHD